MLDYDISKKIFCQPLRQGFFIKYLSSLVFLFLLCYNVLMNIDLSKYVNKNDVIAIALSGGSDSMALLNYMLENQNKFSYSVIALNVEHGIRGSESVSDTEFVKDYCKNHGVKLLTYSVNAIEFSKSNNLTLEEGARKLRYGCFYDAIDSGKCTKIATAHHLSDNFESILLNLFRGTGIKGLTGITDNYNNKIIRPFITVSKAEINEYVEKNGIPFVTDSTNFSDDYTRNYFRLNVIPKIKEVFPEAEKTVLKTADILRAEDLFMQSLSDEILYEKDGCVYIKLPSPVPLIARAVITALKRLGIEKDWEKSHVDGVLNLVSLSNGAMINLPKGIIAIKEYDSICFYKEKELDGLEIPFSVKDFDFYGKKYTCKRVERPTDLKSGFFADLDKIPVDAVIRNKKDGDIFTKFGGGSKKLNDFLTDKKIPLKDRNSIPVLARGNIVYFIFQIAISDLIKVDENSKNIVQFV